MTVKFGMSPPNWTDLMIIVQLWREKLKNVLKFLQKLCLFFFTILTFCVTLTKVEQNTGICIG